MKKHKKHTKLNKPDLGFFSRNEWAIIGTPCGNLKQLAYKTIEELSSNYKVSYVDADHAHADEMLSNNTEKKSALDFGANLEYTDKINFHRFDQKANLDRYQYRQFFNEQDIVIVNGNHFSAKAQIVVLDPKKEKSLSKKLDRLTDVQLLLQEGDTPIYDFLKEVIPNWENIPIYKTNDSKSIAAFLHDKMQTATPPLSGIVLAGGKSRRMGVDKSMINYHGKPQREYLFDLMETQCDKTFMSCRPDQIASFIMHPGLPDSFLGLGPFGAILSAFRNQPNHAWLVVACDLPLIDNKALTYLINNRNTSKIATAFLNPATDFPDPLFTIWEPRAYPVLLQFLAQGFSCPRKVLINSDIELLDVPNPEILKNVNRPEEYDEVMEIINNN